MARRNSTTDYPRELFSSMQQFGTRIMVSRNTADGKLFSQGMISGDMKVNNTAANAVHQNMTGSKTIQGETAHAAGAPFLCENGETPRTGEVYSDLQIAAFQYDHNTGQFHLEANLYFTEKCREITMYADLYDMKEECLMDRFAPQTVTESSCASYSAGGNFKGRFDLHDKVAVLVYADLVEESGSRVEVTAFEEEQGCEMTHTIVHPQKQEHYLIFENGSYRAPTDTPGNVGKADEDVKIALFRLPEDTSDLDYLCNFGKIEPWKGNYPILGVPVHGELGINMGAFYEDANHKSQLICTVAQEGAGGVRVIASSADGSEYAVSVDCDTNGKRSFIYDFVGSWNVGYIHPGMWEQLRYSYTLTFDGFYRIDEHSDIHPCHYSITSGQPVKGKVYEGRAPYLIIEWGCLDKDTAIEMADGSQKRISEIVIGDLVRTADGGGHSAAGMVRNVWRGTEEGCKLITVENGQSIKATGNHPFLTTDGWKQADELQTGDRILADGLQAEDRILADGLQTGEKMPAADDRTFRVTAVETVAEVCEVFNLEFDTPSILFANGLQTGDFLVQNGRLPEGRER